MTIRAVRVNEARSRLNAALRDHLRAEFWYAVEGDLGGNHRAWPADVIEALLLAEMEFRQEVGRVDIVARTYACVPDDRGKPHCVLQITYAKVKQQSVALPSQTERAGGGDQVNAATPARSISPSLCGIGGFGEW